MHTVVMGHNVALQKRLATAHQPGFAHVVHKISGLSDHYRDTVHPIPGTTPLPGVAVGERAPDTVINSCTRVHDLLAHPWYTLLVLQRDPRSHLGARGVHAAKRYGPYVKVVSITDPKGHAAGVLADVVTEDDETFDTYGNPDGDSVVLIRPDGHIATANPCPRTRRWRWRPDPSEQAPFTALNTILAHNAPSPDDSSSKEAT